MIKKGVIMSEYTGLYDFIMFFLSPFADVLSGQEFAYLVNACTIFIFTLCVGGIISAMFGAMSALAAVRGRGK